MHASIVSYQTLASMGQHEHGQDQTIGSIRPKCIATKRGIAGEWTDP